MTTGDSEIDSQLPAAQRRSSAEGRGMQAVAQGFNAAIFFSAGLCVVAAAVFGLFSDLTNLITTGGLLLAMGMLQLILKRGWVRSTSVAMLALLFAGVYLSMYRFGSVSIAQASLALIPIIYCVVVLGARAGVVLVLLSILTSGLITWAEVHGHFAHAPPIIPAIQWAILSVGFVIAYQMAVLVKRHLLDAARQANLAQAQLLAERERSTARVLKALAELEGQKYVIDQHAIVVKVNLTGRITYGNQKFSEVTGYSPEEFLGQPVTMLRSGVHDAAFFAKMRETINNGHAWRAEVCHRAKDGHLFWLDATVAAFMNEDGTPREYIGVNTDITQLRQAQQAADAASVAKSEFLANMSHEIRTPMNAVIGLVEVLRTTPLAPAQQRMLDTVHTSSLALLQILNDILDFSKIEAGRLDVEAISVSLRGTLDTVTQLTATLAASQGIDFSVYIDPLLPPFVQTDPTRLRQILFNLLSNALKFTPARAQRAGHVRLRVGRATLTDGSDALELRVSDNGIGMERALIDHLFEPFTQADASTARKYGGTGLGLSITRRLVEILNGALQVHSAPEQGSVFTVLLPLVPGQVPEPLVEPVPALPGAPGQPQPAALGPAYRLLLVEDNLTNRDVTLEQLRLLGYEADWAADGAQGLALWRSGRFRLILSDCHMPQMDGFAMTAAIRAAELPHQHIPIVALTANALRGESQRCLDAGMDDYLSKPLRLEALRTTLARWLPTHAGPPPATAVDRADAASADAAQDGDVVWDAQALSAALGINDAQVQDRMLRRFAQHAGEQIQSMQGFWMQGNFAQVGALAHNAKSAARTVGAMQLGHLCHLLELECTQGEGAQAPALLSAITQAFAAVQEFLPEAAPVSVAGVEGAK